MTCHGVGYGTVPARRAITYAVIQRILVGFQLNFSFLTVIQLLLAAEKFDLRSDFRNQLTIRPSDLYEINRLISFGFLVSNRDHSLTAAERISLQSGFEDRNVNRLIASKW